MNYIEEIRKMMEDNGVEAINFLYHKTRPTIQKDGTTYEILGITAPGEGESTINLEAVAIRPSYEFKLVYLEMDATWRKTSWSHMSDIIKTEINRWNGW